MVVTMKELLEAGVHFGHQTKRWNPKMKPYIFWARNGIYIIDLQKTVTLFQEAYQFIKETAAKGEYILFVGTKKQAQDAIQEEATRCNMFYVNRRWLGGTLTNFKTIKKSIERLKSLENLLKDEEYCNQIPKKELLKLEKQRKKLEKALGGIKNMDRLPGAVFIVDSKKERIAVSECRKLSIPIVAIVDTNSDPEEVDYVIPGNDDAIRAIRLFTSRVANAVIEGRAEYEEKLKAEGMAEEEIVEKTEEAAEVESSNAEQAKEEIVSEKDSQVIEEKESKELEEEVKEEYKEEETNK
ncbi:MAG: 30S ribosomal protein S2 [Deltaproteobacteria bacterium]|nr:30S ribosomal protein S2 [Deltaproteobacteria bacterium]RLA88000.1 MAG: 30S ribosomal protein S2 [Deltaproteobacteria bacterium]